LVQHDGFLTALRTRDKVKLKKALAQINKGCKSCPILATPYLIQALAGGQHD